MPALVEPLVHRGAEAEGNGAAGAGALGNALESLESYRAP